MTPRPAIGYRASHRRDLLSDDPRCQGLALEITADHFFANPLLLDALAERYPIYVHDTGSSLGYLGPSQERLAMLRDLCRRSHAVLFSDHLALTRSESIDLGHLCPIPYTKPTLFRLVDGVKRLQDTLGVEVALENIAMPFTVPGTLSEGELWSRLVEETGCGMLLDLTNLLFDTRNEREPEDVEAACERRLEELPLHAVRAIHLAGGRAEGNWWIDSHSAPVEADVFELCRRALARTTAVSAVIVERDAHLPDVFALIAEARRAIGQSPSETES